MKIITLQITKKAFIEDVVNSWYSEIELYIHGLSTMLPMMAVPSRQFGVDVQRPPAVSKELRLSSLAHRARSPFWFCSRFSLEGGLVRDGERPCRRLC